MPEMRFYWCGINLANGNVIKFGGGLIFRIVIFDLNWRILFKFAKFNVLNLSNINGNWEIDTLRLEDTENYRKN